MYFVPMKSYTLPKSINKRIGKAMHDYSMLDDGDRVLVAVSGGVDSLALTWLLHRWQKKTPISYDLICIHIDNDFWDKQSGCKKPAAAIASQLDGHGIDLRIVPGRIVDDERTCFICAKHRRNQLFDLAAELSCNKIAFGHHKDDLIETFFLNILYSGNISTMLPNQTIFDGELQLIRPMAYIEKCEVEEIAAGAGLQPVDNLCPLADNTKRDKVRNMLQHIYDQEPGAKRSLFASLNNVREGYML